MRSIVFVVPGPLDARTGGSIYDRRMVEGLRQRGWPVDVLELDASFPYPTPAALDQADRALAGVREGSVSIVDSLALGAMPDLIIRDSSRLRIVALVHLPLAATVGLDRETAARFEDGERRALRAVSLVIVSGKAALPLLSTYGLPADRVVIIEPGTDRTPLAKTYVVSGFSRTSRRTPSRTSSALELLCVATLNPGKGHEMLLEALAAVSYRSWRLTCAGSLTRDAATAERVRATIARLGLGERVSLAGDLDREALEASYDRADLFVLATRQETYGMAVAEALARGLPVVATMTGAIPELVGNEAGLLVPVGDTSALAGALSRVLGDAALRARLAEGARHVRDRLPTWDEAAGRMADALESLNTHG
jgi:glycosyltransferase involved in cell wall biosynthesis